MKILLLAMLMPIIGLVLLSKLAFVGTFLVLKIVFVPALFLVTFVFGYELGRRSPAPRLTI